MQRLRPMFTEPRERLLHLAIDYDGVTVTRGPGEYTWYGPTRDMPALDVTWWRDANAVMLQAHWESTAQQQTDASAPAADWELLNADDEVVATADGNNITVPDAPDVPPIAVKVRAKIEFNVVNVNPPKPADSSVTLTFYGKQHLFYTAAS